MKLSNKTKNYITQTGRWLLFISVWLTINMKIAEAASSKTLELVTLNPEIANCSLLLQIF